MRRVDGFGFRLILNVPWLSSRSNLNFGTSASAFALLSAMIVADLVSRIPGSGSEDGRALRPVVPRRPRLADDSPVPNRADRRLLTGMRLLLGPTQVDLSPHCFISE
jgi:hypothetical protein